MKTTKSDAIPIYIPSYWTILWKQRNPIMSIVTFVLMMKKYMWIILDIWNIFFSKKKIYLLIHLSLIFLRVKFRADKNPTIIFIIDIF